MSDPLQETLDVLHLVFKERLRQNEKHGNAMAHLPDGTGPAEMWLEPLCGDLAARVQRRLRAEYEDAEKHGQLTRMHLVREEIAEAFELTADHPEFEAELIQVAALCVQWVEILRGERAGPVLSGLRCVYLVATDVICGRPADEIWFADGTKGFYCSEHADEVVGWER